MNLPFILYVHHDERDVDSNHSILYQSPDVSARVSSGILLNLFYLFSRVERFRCGLRFSFLRITSCQAM